MGNAAKSDTNNRNGVEWVDGSVGVGGGWGILSFILYIFTCFIIFICFTQTCFGHNSTQKASPEELQVGIFTKLSEYCEFAIKRRFSKIGFFAQKATSGPKFDAKLVLAITRRRMNEHRRFVGESSHNFT